MEILNLFPELATHEITDVQIVEIDNLYHEYERRILWKANQIENQRHDTICAKPTADQAFCKCRTRQQEVWEWEDWFVENYDKEPFERDFGIPISILQKVSPPKPSNTEKHHQETT